MKRKRYFTLEQTNKMIKELNKRIKIDIVKENVYLKDLIMQQKQVLDKIKEYIKENIADIEFMEKEYGIDILNTEIEVEYNDIKKLIELLEEIE